MRIIKRFFILLLLELIMLVFLYDHLPSAWKMRKEVLHETHLGSEIIIENIANDHVLITAKKFEDEATQEVELQDAAGATYSVTWLAGNEIMISAQLRIRSAKDDIEVMIYNHALSENPINFEVNDLLKNQQANKQPSKQPQTSQEPQEEPKEEPQPSNPISSILAGSAPEVYAVTTFTKDSQLQSMASKGMAKPSSPDTNNDALYHEANGTMYDIKIEAGNVFVTQNQGVDWISVPIQGIRLQDSWLYYYRMGDQSYYIDSDIILIGFAQAYEQPHLIYSDDHGATWKDILIDCGTTQIIQISIGKQTDGTLQIAMLSEDQQVFYGTSSDGVTWNFEQPVVTGEVFSDLYSMALMSDGAIFITKYQDCAMSFDHGRRYYHLRDLAPDIARAIDVQQIPYEEDGTYCIPLQDGQVAKSRDGTQWTIE